MHKEAFLYVAELARRFKPRTVIEFGARNYNGTVIENFDAKTYVKLDIEDGPEIDIVEDASTFVTNTKYDMVVCCEVLEHTPFGAEIIYSAWNALTPSGVLVLTCATNPRPPHSSNGEEMLDTPSEYYLNVEAHQMAHWLNPNHWTAWEMQVDRRRGDLYVTSVKGGRNLR